MRTVKHRYRDPLDHIWLTVAKAIGLTIERSKEVYASTDGRGTLAVGARAILDSDDNLAQMIFHELCHSLIEGRESFERPDWGLDNTSSRDAEREHACLRLQATLAGEYGLRRFLAPTTDFRGFYDELGPDPLSPRHEASVRHALLGIRRADKPPWGPHLRRALEATATIARTAASFADGRSEPAGPGQRDTLPALWQRVDPAPERHQVGFPMAAPRHQSDGESDGQLKTCGSCAWCYRGGPGRPVERCRQADGARVSGSWPGCNRWESQLDCQDCGACCREAYHSVTISQREPVIRLHPELVVDRGSYIELARTDDPRGNRCAALRGGPALGSSHEGGSEPYSCAIYPDRPRPCRELENAGPHCLTARRRVGLSR